MKNTVFDKTEKGREEIATRQYHLPTRLRTLLLLVDGKHPAGDLLGKVASLGLTEQSFADLQDNGFIRVMAEEQPGSHEHVHEMPELVAPPAPPERAPVLPDGKSQFEAIYEFYTATIKSTIGLRGYALQLKVEKAANIDDFRQLRRPYLEAVLKARGEEMARSLRDRLDQLLNLGGNNGGDMGSTVLAAHVGE